MKKLFFLLSKGLLLSAMVCSTASATPEADDELGTLPSQVRQALQAVGHGNIPALTEQELDAIRLRARSNPAYPLPSTWPDSTRLMLEETLVRFRARVRKFCFSQPKEKQSECSVVQTYVEQKLHRIFQLIVNTRNLIAERTGSQVADSDAASQVTNLSTLFGSGHAESPLRNDLLRLTETERALEDRNQRGMREQAGTARQVPRTRNPSRSQRGRGTH